MAAGFMTHVTCRLTAKNRDQLRNPTLGSRVWTTFFTFYTMQQLLFAGSTSARSRPKGGIFSHTLVTAGLICGLAVVITMIVLIIVIIWRNKGQCSIYS